MSATGTLHHFGRFIENGACFEAHATPQRRWMNVHHNAYFDGANGSHELFAQVSQYGDGPVHYRRPTGECVSLVGWESSALYVRDDMTGLVFCPGGAPMAKPVERRLVRYRAESTEICSGCDGLETTWRIFAPRLDPVLVWTLRVRNTAERQRVVSVVAGLRFGLAGPCVDVDAELQGVYAWMHDSRGKDTHDRAFLSVSTDYLAATAHREDLLQPGLGFGTPRLLEGRDLGNISAAGFDAVGATQARFTLEPGAERRVDFLIGHAPCLETAIALRRRLDAEHIDVLLEEVRAEQRRLAAAYTVDTGHPHIDAIYNHFVKKQHIAYLANKSGFRDNVQVCVALDLADEQLAGTALLRALSHQYADGWAPHGFRPVGSKQCSDEPAWILWAVPEHVKQTGDFGFLETRIPFLDSTVTATVWEHVVRAARWLMRDTRPSGLCDLRSGDWNDGLSPRGDTGGRASVMVTQQLCLGLLEVAALADRIGRSEVAAEFRAAHSEFARRINATAWDGAWYTRVLCDDGTALGTHSAEEGRIFINSQSWAVIGQVAPADRAVRCMDSLEMHLKLDIGYRLVAPPFSRFNPKVGGSSTVFPGVIENGGCYNHAAGFKAVADCMLGRAEAAWDTLLKVAPDNPENPLTRSHMEPFAFSNMFFADRYRYARSLYAWNTGTGVWFALLLVEHILGVRRDYDGLRIRPCITRRIPHARLTRIFRGGTYHVEIDNTAGRCTGVSLLEVNGRAMEGTLVPVLGPGAHRVRVVI